jgi:signal transduction histidine kinase
MIRTHLRLRSQLLVAFAVVLLPVLALLWFDFRVSMAQQEESILGDQLLSAQAIAVEVDEAFDSLIALGSAVASDPLVLATEPARMDGHLRELLERAELATVIAVFDAEGRNRGWGAEGLPPEPRIDVSESVDFRRAMATDLPHVSDVLPLPRVGSIGVLVVVPIRSPNGHAAGVVMVGVSMDKFFQLYEHTRLRPGQALLLADRTGRLAVHTARRYMTYDETSRLRGFEPLWEALSGMRSTDAKFSSPVTGDLRLAAFVSTQKYRWVAGVTFPRDIAFGPIRKTFEFEIGAFAGILLLSVLLALFLARYLVDPVHRLESAAEALGKGDLARRVVIGSRDEIGRLGAAFNAMGEQLNRLYREQRDLLRIREDFIQAAAHELKTPIATIKSAIHVLLGKQFAPESRRLLEIIGRQARRMALLGEDLLTVTSLRGPIAQLEVHRFDLGALLQQAVQQIRESSDRQTICLAAPPTLVVEADHHLIELVVLRLLENAAAASPENARIEVSSMRAGGDAQISVHDEGPVIPEERRPHVFEPFYEAVPSGQPGYRGVISLRLHVCKRIVDAHRGRIWFSSGPHGSTLSFTLPLAEETSAVAAAACASPNPPP